MSVYKNILVPMALNHGLSEKTLAVARSLLADGGKITAMHVFEVPTGSISAYLGEKVLREGYAAASELLAQKVSAHSDITPVMREGHTARSILDQASEDGTDCIVIASHMPGLGDYLLGSTTSKVVRHAQCSVHVLRGRN